MSYAEFFPQVIPVILYCFAGQMQQFCNLLRSLILLYEICDLKFSGSSAVQWRLTNVPIHPEVAVAGMN